MRQGDDWLRPTAFTHQRVERASLLPLITSPTAKDHLLTALAGVVLGAMCGVSVVLAICS